MLWCLLSINVNLLFPQIAHSLDLAKYSQVKSLVRALYNWCISAYLKERNCEINGAEREYSNVVSSETQSCIMPESSLISSLHWNVCIQSKLLCNTT